MPQTQLLSLGLQKHFAETCGHSCSSTAVACNSHALHKIQIWHWWRFVSLTKSCKNQMFSFDVWEWVLLLCESTSHSTAITHTSASPTVIYTALDYLILPPPPGCTQVLVMKIAVVLFTHKCTRQMWRLTHHYGAPAKAAPGKAQARSSWCAGGMWEERLLFRDQAVWWQTQRERGSDSSCPVQISSSILHTNWEEKGK